MQTERGLETTSPLPLPAAPPPNPFLRSIASCPEHYGTGAGSPGAGERRQRAGQARPRRRSALSPRSRPLRACSGQAERDIPGGCEKVIGSPGPVWPIPPGGHTAGKWPPAGCSAKGRVKRRALCGRLSAASGGAFQPLWYAKWLVFTAAAAAGGKGARRAGKRKPGAGKGKSAEVPT